MDLKILRRAEPIHTKLSEASMKNTYKIIWSDEHCRTSFLWLAWLGIFYFGFEWLEIDLGLGYVFFNEFQSLLGKEMI